jgi:hypothetical protein
MFEPLQAMFTKGMGQLDDRFREVIEALSLIAENTQAEIWIDRFTTKSNRENTGKSKTAVVELGPSEGVAWRVFLASVTAGKEGPVAVYLNTVDPSNLLDLFNPSEIAARKVEYYVPPGSKLVFHFYEQPEEHECTANIQAEQFLMQPGKAHGNRSGEHVDMPDRIPPIPSGHPVQ